MYCRCCDGLMSDSCFVQGIETAEILQQLIYRFQFLLCSTICTPAETSQKAERLLFSFLQRSLSKPAALTAGGFVFITRSFFITVSLHCICPMLEQHSVASLALDLTVIFNRTCFPINVLISQMCAVVTGFMLFLLERVENQQRSMPIYAPCKWNASGLPESNL